MRRRYDFSKGRPNPYAARLKQSVTIRLDTTAVAYFKRLAAELEIPYQTLINLYLRDCATARPELERDPLGRAHPHSDHTRPHAIAPSKVDDPRCRSISIGHGG
jgi:hypothetical protein